MPVLPSSTVASGLAKKKKVLAPAPGPASRPLPQPADWPSATVKARSPQRPQSSRPRRESKTAENWPARAWRRPRRRRGGEAQGFCSGPEWGGDISRLAESRLGCPVGEGRKDTAELDSSGMCLDAQRRDRHGLFTGESAFDFGKVSNGSANPLGEAPSWISPSPPHPQKAPMCAAGVANERCGAADGVRV